MKILLLGPCSLVDISHLLNSNDVEISRNFEGKRGIPVSSLASTLVKMGHKVVILTLSQTPIPDVQILKGPNFEIRLIPSRLRIRTLALTFFREERRRIVDEIKLIDPNVVHAHWTYEYALAGLSSKKPLVITAHDAPFKIFGYFLDPFRLIRLIMAIVVRIKCESLIFVSPYLMNQWRKEMFWNHKSKVIPNSSPFIKGNLSGANKDLLHVLIVSDSGRRKNVKTGIKAWQLVLDKFPEAELHLIGRGLESASTLAEWATIHNLNRSIIWHGYLGRSEVIAAIRNSKILLQPSFEESFGLTLLEAMSQGIPVVGGQNSGGVPFVIGDGGLIVNVKKAHEISTAIINLLSNTKLAESLGENGSRRAASTFSENTVAEKYVHEYEETIKGKI